MEPDSRTASGAPLRSSEWYSGNGRDAYLHRAATVAGFADPKRGWERLYVHHVQQADTGADLDFLLGSTVSRESH